jgi:hypothetical protein
VQAVKRAANERAVTAFESPKTACACQDRRRAGSQAPNTRLSGGGRLVNRGRVGLPPRPGAAICRANTL